jgi:hypothetical protein
MLLYGFCTSAGKGKAKSSLTEHLETTDGEHGGIGTIAIATRLLHGALLGMLWEVTLESLFGLSVLPLTSNFGTIIKPEAS